MPLSRLAADTSFRSSSNGNHISPPPKGMTEYHHGLSKHIRHVLRTLQGSSNKAEKTGSGAVAGVGAGGVGPGHGVRNHSSSSANSGSNSTPGSGPSPGPGSAAGTSDSKSMIESSGSVPGSMTMSMSASEDSIVTPPQSIGESSLPLLQCA